MKRKKHMLLIFSYTFFLQRKMVVLVRLSSYLNAKIKKRHFLGIAFTQLSHFIVFT